MRCIARFVVSVTTTVHHDRSGGGDRHAVCRMALAGHGLRVAIASIALAVLLLIPDVLPAQDQEVTYQSPAYSLTLGVREWITQGRSAHNIGSAGVNVASELSWRGANSVITQVTGDLVFKRFVMNVSVGHGGINNGNLLDQDWDGPNRTLLSAATNSRIEDGGIWIVSVTPGVRLFEWSMPDNPILGGYDLMVGYQFWREQYIAFGGTDVLNGNPPLPDTRTLKQTNTWQSMRIGMRTTFPAFSFLAIKGGIFYIPFNSYRNEDIHDLRTDLRKDPSFLTTATGGNGVQVEGSVMVRLWRGLTAEAGYAYWDIRSGTGTIQQFNADGTVSLGTHNEENTKRQGVFFALNWVF